MSTLRAVTREGMSLTRFGDGELRLAFKGKPAIFQDAESDLSARLREALLQPKPAITCTFNHYYADHIFVDWIKKFERYPKTFTKHRTVHEENDIGVLFRPRDAVMYLHYWRSILRKTRYNEYGDTSVFYLGCYIEQYEADEFEIVLDEFRRLYTGRRILFVAPERPHGGAAFREECDTLRRIGLAAAEFLAVPERNAYGSYHSIVAEILKFRDVVDDVHISAGPTASVLAYDLVDAFQGRVLDVGSLNTQIRYLG